ncbi:MAG: thioredoxin domain-containing protein [Saonia sp.]
MKNENIELNYDEFVFQVKSHPDYPSLLSYSDALTFFNIKNAAYKIKRVANIKLPDLFVALLVDENSGRQELSFVQKKKDSFFINNNKSSHKILLKKWGGIIFLAEQDELNSNTQNPNKHFWKWILFIFSILIIIVPNINKPIPSWFFVFIALSTIGILLAIETIKQELGVKSAFSERFCKSFKDLDCSSVINSNKLGLLKKVPLNDIAIVFFSGQFISLWIMFMFGSERTFYLIQNIGLWMVIPISLISIYFQWKIEKKWCTLCLIIILVLYVELLTVRLNPNIGFFSFNGLFLFFGIHLLALSFWLFIKPVLLRNKSLKEKMLQGLRFKKNYSLFKVALSTEKPLKDSSPEGSFLLGNREAALKISFVTSPLCGYCKDAHKLVEDILKTYSGKISFFLRFNLNPALEKDNRKLKLHRALTQIYINEGQDAFMATMEDWFENRDLTVWTKQTLIDIDNREVDTILKNQYDWCEKNGFLFTPEFAINGYKYPDAYEREYLKDFIPDLLEDFDLKENDCESLKISTQAEGSQLFVDGELQ